MHHVHYIQCPLYYCKVRASNCIYQRPHGAISGATSTPPLVQLDLSFMKLNIEGYCTLLLLLHYYLDPIFPITVSVRALFAGNT